MSDGIKLFDLRESDYPNKRGDLFRSLQVFKCCICGAKTNKVEIGGSAGYGIRSICPHATEKWHHDLESKINLRNTNHPSSYSEELESEIEAVKSGITSLIKDDLSGSPDFSLERDVTNTWAEKRS